MNKNRPASYRAEGWAKFDGPYRDGYRIDPKSEKCLICRIIIAVTPKPSKVLCGYCVRNE